MLKGKLGICYQADILIEKIENAQDLTALLQTQQLQNDIWQAIGKLIRQLHDLQICHTDLNAHNILVQQLEMNKNVGSLISISAVKIRRFLETRQLRKITPLFCQRSRQNEYSIQ